MVRRRQLLAGGLTGLLAGCVNDSAVTPPALNDGSPPTTDLTSRAYTYQRPNGNRLVDGAGSVPDAEPVDVAIDWTPAWMVGLPAGYKAGLSFWPG